MIAVVCDWGGDLSVGSGGDIAVAPVQIEIQQRLIRRLLTTRVSIFGTPSMAPALAPLLGSRVRPV
jgi:hypothetical protein